MATFEERQKAFENKFKYDEELSFRIASRRARLVGLWAADKMKLENPGQYALELVQVDIERGNHAALIEKLQADFAAHKKTVSLHRIEREMISQLEAARLQVMGSMD